MRASPEPHVELALTYARDVTEGRIPACGFVKAACRRQLEDLKRFEGHKLYEWHPEAAGHVCRFIEMLPHVKGPKAKADENIHLEPWQCFVLTTVFGWRRADTKGRRFRRVYIEVPRGNAKSTLSSGVGLYCLALDGEQGAEVYSAATTREQARIIYGDAFSMMKKRPALAERIGVVAPRTAMTAAHIVHVPTSSKFVPLSRESSNLDGLNVHVALIDELHAHKDREIYDVIETGTAKRNASLLWCITTAGSNTAGICYEIRSYTIKVLEGLEDESQFGIIYTLDDGDDWTSPAAWAKANPNWGVSVSKDVTAQLAAKAMVQASAQNNFKTKVLNIWVNADVQWMEMRAFDRLAMPDLKPEDFEKEALYVGLDLATKVDIACKSRIFIRMHPKFSGDCTTHERPGNVECNDCYPVRSKEREPHFYVFLTSYLPEFAIEDGRNSQYVGWAIEGWLQSTPGDVTDFGIIKADVLEDSAKYRLRDVAYDPWQTAQLAQELQDHHGVNTVEVRAIVQNFSAPMKEFEALVLAGRLHHCGDPVFRWMVSNTVCHRDAKDNIYPRKEQPQNKIDGVVASLMALGRALTEDDPYATGGLKSL